MVGRILIIKEKKFSPGPGIEPGSPALSTGVLTTKPPRQYTWPSRNIFSYWILPYPHVALLLSIRVVGEHLRLHYF